ncbi:MAG: nucleotide pyrophosphohydrolase [Magnetococcales bacterium]|nr:nucleotide pyrophosphohydrolase [Magnetococcales bacterium]
MNAEMQRLILALREFAREREWGPFHTPKNLAGSVCIEAAELLELFQWLTPEQSATLDDPRRQDLADEIGDVMLYLTMLADRFGLDPLRAAFAKMEKNRIKYPPHHRGPGHRHD